MILSVKASINNDAGHTGLCVLFADDMGRHFLDVTQFMRGSKGEGGTRGLDTPFPGKSQKWLSDSLEILVRTPSRSNWTSGGTPGTYGANLLLEGGHL